MKRDVIPLKTKLMSVTLMPCRAGYETAVVIAVAVLGYCGDAVQQTAFV